MEKKNKKPIIGITAVASFDETMHSQKVTYAQAVWAAGGEAILLPCNPDKNNCRQIVSMLDGLLVPGGHDMDPTFYGESVQESCGTFVRYEDEYDMELIKEAVTQGKPVFGICRGMQIINVLYGGTLYQDIPSQYLGALIHTRIHVEQETYHIVNVKEGSYLATMLEKTKDVKVNSSHHQAVKEVAEGFEVTAKSPDGIIEAMENRNASILCVQWHPERMQDVECWKRIMDSFINRCK